MSNPRLTLVIPTLNEADGIVEFLDRLLPIAAAVQAEVLVVDDSSRDGTAELARQRLGDAGRVLVRQGPPSLARSVLEGWEQGRAPVLAVMDADLSHPPELLPRLLEAVEGGADMAMATRYMPGGGVEGWPWRRRLASRFASLLARSLTRARDPLSGYFVLRRDAIAGAGLDPRGWKIGLEVLVRGRCQQVAEIPYVFHDREYGRSKFGRRAVTDYLAHLGRLLLARRR